MSDTSDLYFSPASLSFLFFFFNDPATTEIYTLSLHDALPIFGGHPDAVRELHRHVALGRHIVHRHAPPPRIALPLAGPAVIGAPAGDPRARARPAGWPPLCRSRSGRGRRWPAAGPRGWPRAAAPRPAGGAIPRGARAAAGPGRGSHRHRGSRSRRRGPDAAAGPSASRAGRAAGRGSDPG